jgi:hypothetical protein
MKIPGRIPLFVLTLVTSFLVACNNPKDWGFDYDECFPFIPLSESIRYQYRFSEDLFMRPGLLTIRGKIDLENGGSIPDENSLNFQHIRRGVKLVQFNELLDVDNAGRFGPIKVNFLDPGVQFKKNDRLNFVLDDPNDPISSSKWNFKGKFRRALEPALLPTFPAGSMTISIGKLDELEQE